MTKKGLLVLVGVVGVIGLIVFIFTGDLGAKKAAISLDAYPSATVYIDGREAGSTPYENDNIEAGEVDIRLVPEQKEIDQVWKKKLILNPNTQTFVSREFNSNPELTGGRLIYLEKIASRDKAGLMINCKPDECSVSVDNQMQGFTPLNLEDVGEGEHRISISAPGYKEVEIMARTLKGYRLVAEVELVKQEEGLTDQLTPTPNETEVVIPQVLINETPTGWLRVRGGPGTSYEEVGRVEPGEKFNFLEEDSGWYKIEYEEGEEGWVSNDYAEKSE
jgi:hypothetical protein